MSRKSGEEEEAVKVKMNEGSGGHRCLTRWTSGDEIYSGTSSRDGYYLILIYCWLT